MGKNLHPADETSSDYLLHFWLPLVLAIIVFSISIMLDLKGLEGYWIQRSGSLITVIGAYLAYYESKSSIKVIDGSIYINSELPYRIASIIVVTIGTILWGYGDMFFR